MYIDEKKKRKKRSRTPASSNHLKGSPPLTTSPTPPNDVP
jgi:hypothetical protein